MEIYIVLATTFVLGAALALFWSKLSYEKQLQQAKSAADKKFEDLLVDKIILEHRLILFNQERENTTAVNY